MKIKILVVLLVLFIPVIAITAQDIEPVRFVQGAETFDNFLNNILNDIQAFLLLTVAPATGLIVVGRNIGKRFLPETISSQWVQLAIMAVLFPLFHFANAAGASQELQSIVDLLTQLGQLLFVGGVTTVASSQAFKVAASHDNTVFGFEKPAKTNG